MTKTIELKVTVTELQIREPALICVLHHAGCQGKIVSGRCELPAATALARLGWTRTTFTPGQKITIKGAPARNEENVCMLQSFIGEDGREISRNEDLTKIGADPLATLASTNRATPRPARLPNGHPNLQGPWVGVGGPDGRRPGRWHRWSGGLRPGPGGGRGPGTAEDAVGADEADRRASEETPAGVLAAKNYDQPFDDPAIKCDLANILFGWVHDRHVNDIIQKDDEITMKYGYMDLRSYDSHEHVRASQEHNAVARPAIPSVNGKGTPWWWIPSVSRRVF